MLEQSVLDQLDRIKGAEILVGIASYNHAPTIGHVAQAVALGLAKYFPGAKSVLFNSDGGSTDGTREELAKVRSDHPSMIITSHSTYPIDRISVPYHGIPGKESAFRNVFEAAELLDAKACAVIDPDLRSIQPEWMDLLLRPVYEGRFDCVVPVYARHRFDGTMTNAIVYPLTRSLYGKRVHQPIGGDFGFSGALAKRYRSKDVWQTDMVRFGIEVWMTTLAIAEGYRVCESHLGARIHAPRAAGSDLGHMFSQVVSSVYALMEDYEDAWKGVTGSQAVPTFGTPQRFGLEPVSVNVERMIGIFRLGVTHLMEFWRRALTPETAQGLESIGRSSDHGFFFPEDLWVRLIYDFGVAYHKSSVHRDHLMKSMIPLYLGEMASFVKANQKSPAREVEERIESLCMTFENLKAYLIEHWE